MLKLLEREKANVAGIQGSCDTRRVQHKGKIQTGDITLVSHHEGKLGQVSIMRGKLGQVSIMRGKLGHHHEE